MSPRILSLVLVFSSLAVYAQKSFEGDIKYWEEGALEFSDFVLRPVSSVKNRAGSVHTGMKPVREKYKNGNLTVDYYRVRSFIDKEGSWLLSDSDSLVLRHAQNLLDMAELCSRLYELELNNISEECHPGDYFDRLFNSTSDSYNSESAYGLDTMVIRDYSERLTKKLIATPRMSVEELVNGPLRLERGSLLFGNNFYFGYLGSHYLGPWGEAAPLINAIIAGGELFSVGKIDFAPEVAIGFSGKPRQPYPTEAFSSSLSVHRLHISMSASHSILDTNTWNIAPFAALGISQLSQNQTDEETGEKKTIGENGALVSAGIDVNYKLARNLFLTDNVYSEYRIGLKLFVGYQQFHHLGNLFSINFGLCISEKDFTPSISRQ